MRSRTPPAVPPVTEPVPVESGTTTVSTTTPGSNVAAQLGAGGLGGALAVITGWVVSEYLLHKNLPTGIEGAFAIVYGSMIAAVKGWRQSKRATSTTTTTTVPAGDVTISAPPADDGGVT